MKIKNLFILPLLLSSLVACNTNNSSTNLSTSSSTIDNTTIPSDLKIEIQKDGVSVEEFNIIQTESLTLTTKNNKEMNVEILWSIADSSIASIDENGLITAINTGITIITAKVKNAPYISASCYVKVKDKVEQTGVGNGTSTNPIFLGNEGKSEPLEIYFLEMQHIYADSIYIKKGNVDILIDTGWDYDGKYVAKFLEEHMNDEILDVLMFSHSDGDHIDGIPSALKNIENISLMVDYGGIGNGNVGTIRSKFKEKGMIYHSAYDCINHIDGALDRYYLTDEFYFDVLNTGNYVNNDATSAGNAKSLATIFYYKDFKFFTAGDLTSGSEEDLMKNENLPEVTLYKASHHGSHGSNSQDLLDELNPKAVAISAARANNYSDTPGAPNKKNTYNLNAASGHPAAAAIERIYKAPNISQNLNVYWNAVNGTMKFSTHGENNFTFEGSPTMKGYYDLTVTDGSPVWNDEIQDFENKVTGEENYRLHETKVFQFRDYIQYLPTWAQEEYFPK